MAHPPTHSPTLTITRFHFAGDKLEKHSDQLAIEEPLEIILDFQKPKQQDRQQLTLAITMRTPGNDTELAAGFLFAEGIIRDKTAIADIASDKESLNPENSIRVTLAGQLEFEPDRLQRNFFTHSSCGVCGKTSMQALELLHQPRLPANTPLVSAKTLCQLPQRLRQQQAQFDATGGVHSAALFSPEGQLLMLKEDVGRHNAMDKLIGALLLEEQLHLARQSVLLVSGRASFELVQKALMADIPILVSIGAPTSLACQLANRHNMTLAGFLKADSFNLYSLPERIN